MKYLVSNRKVLIPSALIGALVLCGGILYAAHLQVVLPFPGTTATLPVQQSYWEARIQAIGGEAAYQEFSKDVADDPPDQQHNSAHAFGGALYEVEGLPGLTVCDSNFSYGCFHEFLGRAIASLGLSVVDQLDQSCFGVHGIGIACQHGIGHGILAYVGYSQPDLLKALGICKNVPYIDPIGGCYSGVFMEYNMQTMLGNSGHLRPATSDLLAPCDQLPNEYASSCYYNQAEWLSAYFLSKSDNMDDVYKRVGALCDEVSTQFKAMCFYGAGTDAPSDANYNISKAIQLCDEMSSNQTDQLDCLSFAANALTVSAPDKNGDGIAICQGLTGDAYKTCSEYASNQANIATPPTLDEKSRQ